MFISSIPVCNRFGLLLIASTLLFCILLVPTHQIGYAVSPYGEQHGDAPNSSVCRAALKNATTVLEKCEVTRTLRGCQFDSGFVQYLQFEFCVFGEQILPTVFLILWLIILLGAFATIADSFFSPSLIALARTMHMGENLAGVTLLAFGNGAPDVFSAVTAITTGDPDAPDEGLGLGFLLGSGLLVNTVTAGLVIASTPFKMSRRPFLKDIFFYLSAVSWSALILIRRRLYYADAIGFLVFYCCYVLVTWAGGTIHRRQKEAEKRYGSGTFWPTPIQRLLDGVNRTWVKIKQPLAVCFNRACPMYTRFRKELCKLKRKPEKGETPGTQSDVGSQAVEKSAAAGQPFVMNGSLANGGVGEQGKNTISQRTYPTLKKPTIEVTSHEDPDYQLDAPGSPYTPSADITADQSRASPMQPAENMIPMNLIQPGEHHRKRASSVGTSNENCNPRRLSTSTPGPGVLTRDRCGRSYSVNRRRASARMSTVGYELPYLVRWIIANRELEEKDLGTSELRPPRGYQSEAEGGLSSGYAGSALDVPSSQGSKRVSRRTSIVTSPIRCPSPSPSDFSLDEGKFEKNAVSAKKITLDLVPKETLSMTTPEQVDGGQDDTAEASQTEEVLSSEASWLIQWASKGVWHHFAYYMIPIDVDSWPNLSIISKISQVLKVPIFVIFRLTIPTVFEELTDEAEILVDRGELVEVTRSMDAVVEESESGTNTSLPRCSSESLNSDPEKGGDSVEDVPFELDLEAMHGWCKPLNVAQCIIVPTLWPLLLTTNGKSFGISPIAGSQVPVFVPFTLGGVAIAVAVYFTSTWNQPPRFYHRPFFATLGFATSIIWIYTLAHELVNLLEALGIVWEISEAILGVSVMALASSIGDIMSNCLLARNGYPRIAYAACIGSPLFNLLLGAGLSYTIKISRNNDSFAILSFTLTQAVLFSSLVAVLICNVIVALIFNFKFHRAYGIILIFFYAIFFTIAILIEADVIVSPKNWGLLTGTE